MPADSGFWFHFGDFRFSPASRELQSAEDGRVVRLRPKTCAVLSLLVRNAGAIVTAAEIQDHVWPDVSIQPGVLSASISELRKVLGDQRADPKYIETLHGSGFRFVAGVEVSQHPRPTSQPPTRQRAGNRITDFVGRRDILEQIARLFPPGTGDGARVTVLHGPAGIGKTRLLAEIANAAVAAGGRTLEAQADDASSQPVFWIWSQLLRRFAASCDTETLRQTLGAAAADIAALVPSLHDRLPDLSFPHGADPEISRARLFDGIATFVAHIAQRQPLMVILDDLHRAGADSLALLRSTVAFLRDVPVLFLISYRDGEETDNPVFADMLQRWQGTVQVNSIVVPPLTAAESRKMIGSARPDLSPTLTEQIARDTGGNPFFIREILKSLDLAGVSPLPSPQAYEIPDSILTVLRRRLGNVTAATRCLLTAGAVAGREFDMNVVGAAGGLEREDLLAAVTQAVGSGYLTEAWDEGPRLRFDHALVREALLSDLPRAARCDWHRRIGEALEAAVSADVEHDAPATRLSQSWLWSQLAYHFFEAMPSGDPAKAILYCLRAAQAAAATLSMDQAYVLSERSMKLAEAHPAAVPALLPDILETLAEGSYWKGLLEESETLTARLHDLAVRSDSPDLQARSAVVLARHYFPFRPRIDRKPIDALETALSNLTDTDPALRGLVLARLASALHSQRDSEARRADLATEALAIARALPDPGDRIRVLEAAMMALWDPDHVVLGRAILDDLEEAAQQTGDRTRQVAIQAWRALNLMVAGKLRDARAALDRALEMFQAYPKGMARYYQTRLLFVREILRGDLAAAEAVAAKFATEEPHPDGISAGIGAMFADFALRREHGQLAGLEPLVRMADEMFPAFQWSTGLPYVLLADGRRDEAREEFDRLAARNFAILPPRNEPSGWLFAAGILADACADLEDERRAAELYEKLSPYAGHWIVVHFVAGVYGSVERLLGRLAATMGAADLSRTHFRSAMNSCEREQAVIELAWTNLYYAQCGPRFRVCSNDEALQARHQALDLAINHNLAAVRKAAEQQPLNLGRRRPA